MLLAVDSIENFGNVVMVVVVVVVVVVAAAADADADADADAVVFRALIGAFGSPSDRYRFGYLIKKLHNRDQTMHSSRFLHDGPS